MTATSILPALSEIMQDVLGDPSVQLVPATTASDIEGWDSMVQITFVVSIEHRFGIKFKTAEIEEMHTVGDVVAMIESKQAA